MSREDPKPGRWILPLVVAGIIGFTYVFVNAIPPAPVTTTTLPTGAGTTLPPDETPTIPPTTLDPALSAFIGDLDALEARANELLEQAQQINDAWDDEEATFSGTRSAFEQYETAVQEFAGTVGAVVAPPTVTTWSSAEGAANAMATAAGNMLEGFLDPNSAAGRRSGLADLQAAGAELLTAIDDARAAISA